MKEFSAFVWIFSSVKDKYGEDVLDSSSSSEVEDDDAEVKQFS